MHKNLELVAYIFGPLILSIIILQLVFGALNLYNTARSSVYKKLRLFALDADRGLAEQGYLWLSILSPIMYFFVFGSIAWEGYTPSLSGEGFKKFIELSALPLALLSLCIPLSVLIARVHATHQTSIQIETTRHKNNMDAYYAHRKAMFEYFGYLKEIKYPGDITGDFNAHPRLHLRFFIDKGPSNGTPEVNVEAFETSLKTVSEIQEHIHKALLRKSDPDSVINNYASACTKLIQLSSTLHLPCIYEDLVTRQGFYTLCQDSAQPADADLQFCSLGKDTDQLIGAYRYTRSFLRVLCEFAGYDVKFFNEKRYYSVDKGSGYKSDPYSFRDISDHLRKASDISTNNKMARRAQQAATVTGG
ncbi:hypothetical protein ACLEJQ_10825 [Pseudomonas sp. SMV71]|uniref:hypothetical protein n=1 Tax=Pseudomonas sp. SMV71 TaxID=3390195 RepID=UPI003F83644E